MTELLHRLLAAALAWFFLAVATGRAVPMDSAAARRLPELQEIVGKARAEAPLTEAECDILLGHLSQGDPVLVSLSAWALGRAQRGQERHLERLRVAAVGQTAMPTAFVHVAMARLARISDAEKAAKLRELSRGENAYARVEAAKALAPLEPIGARDILAQLAHDRTFLLRTQAADALRRIAPDQAVETGPAVDDEQYELVLSIIEPPEALVKHEISGESAGRRTTGPFPQRVETLHFAWQLGAGAPPDEVEIRWIAADVGAAAPRDHVISSTKSGAGRLSGEFTLSKPTSGFPPGSYRIEIWQSGRTIHSEFFTIKP